MPDDRDAIPMTWIQRYTKTMLDMAAKFDEGSKMREATLLRVDHIMDMVKAYKGIR